MMRLLISNSTSSADGTLFQNLPWLCEGTQDHARGLQLTDYGPGAWPCQRSSRIHLPPSEPRAKVTAGMTAAPTLSLPCIGSKAGTSHTQLRTRLAASRRQVPTPLPQSQGQQGIKQCRAGVQPNITGQPRPSANHSASAGRGRPLCPMWRVLRSRAGSAVQGLPTW